MDDLKITIWCRKATGLPFKIDDDKNGFFVRIVHYEGDLNGGAYDLINNSAQCFDLIKRFKLDLTWNPLSKHWNVFEQGRISWVADESLSRAVCKCVAAMQASK
jgi:hypothetical protein